MRLPPELREALRHCPDKDLVSGAKLLNTLASGNRDDVHGNVVLSGRAEAEEAVREIPDGMRIRGCLVVLGAKDASLEFPPRLVVDNGLRLVSRANGVHKQLEAVAFGEGLRVGGCLDVSGCSALTSLPKNAHVGSLKADHCCGLTGLPPCFRVDGDVDLSECCALTRLPIGLRVNGTLNLWSCAALASLPEGLKVRGDLDLYECRALTALPESLEVGGTLDLGGCASLEARYCEDMHPLAAQLQATMGPNCGLRLTRWTRLEQLPTGLCLRGSVSLPRCSGLKSLPKDLHVGGDLVIADCTALTSVCEGLRVDGALQLSHCDALTKLPTGLVVNGDLELSSCSALASLPEGLCVGGDIHLEDCGSLESIPASLLELPVREDSGEPHNIFLRATGLSREALQWLREAEAPGLRFHVSLEDEEDEGGEGPEVDEEEWGSGQQPGFANALEAATFWAEEAGEAMAAEVPEDDQTLVQFLSRLRDAKEFGVLETRKALAKRVVAVCELIGQNEMLREELLLRMSDSLDACSDKPIWALNQMHLVAEVARARGDAGALRSLGRRVMRLMVVRDHAKRKVDSLRWVDDVCVHLRFEIDLREALDLPVAAMAMSFPRYIAIEVAELEAAKRDALAISDENFEAWLAEWPEWQRQMRHEVVSKLGKWENLPDVELHQQESLRKRLSRRMGHLENVSGDKMADPVTLDNGQSVWSLGDLLLHWERTGLDLHNGVVSLQHLQDDLRRVL